MVASRTDSKSPAVVMESAPPMHRGVVPLRLQGVEIGQELVESVIGTRFGDPGALENIAVEHEEIRAMRGQWGRVLRPVDRDRGEHILGELRRDVLGE